jgi:hypothetical protein
MTVSHVRDDIVESRKDIYKSPLALSLTLYTLLLTHKRKNKPCLLK